MDEIRLFTFLPRVPLGRFFTGSTVISQVRSLVFLYDTATLPVVPSNVTSCVLIMSCMFKKQLIVIAIVDCMSYCYSDVSVSMYLIVIHSDSNVGSLFKRCFTPVMSVHSS